ncbi:MAG TPA: lytic transglycosylase domain-containing protein [Rhizomicrobium sp.]
MALQKLDTRLIGASPYSAALHAKRCAPGLPAEFGAHRATPRANVALQGIAKLTFLTGIAAAVLFAWQGIALHVQQFSVRPDAVTPVTATVARWVHNAWNVALRRPESVAPLPDAVFAAEGRMSASQLLNRWTPVIATASERFDVPARWIRAVVQMESGGRTMSGAHRPITSRAGAMGVMQLMPGTYTQMRAQYHLGADPYNPQDNIDAGAAYLHWLFRKYGYPAMFAAYNDGPGHLDERLMRGRLLPDETRNYVSRIMTTLGGNAGTSDRVARFTRPNGTPVTIELADIRSVRMALPGEYAPGVNTVITAGSTHQAVRESYAVVKGDLIARGALGVPFDRISTNLSDMSSPERRRDRHETSRTRESRWAPALTFAGRDRIQVSYGGALAGADAIRLRPIRRSRRRA